MVGRLIRIIFSIILVAFSPLHALSGGLQGVVLDLNNPGKSALWGAIGAAGAEVAMEAVYDAEIRSRAILDDMEKRITQGELKEMLGSVGVDLPQEGKARENVLASKAEPLGETRSRDPGGWGRASGSMGAGQGSLKLGEALTSEQRKQVISGLEQFFTKELRADVERSRNGVRAVMSGVALVGGVQANHMSMMDDMADQALTHNAIPLIGYVGGAALEAALPGLLASAAGALGVTYAWDAVTGLFSGESEQIVELPFNTTDDKLPVKGKPGDRAQEIGQSTTGGMMPEDPNDHNEEEPRESKPQKVNKQKPKQPGDLYNKNNKGKFIDRMKKHDKNLGSRDEKPKDATTLRAAEIEATGEQIEIAKQRGVTYDHGHKVRDAQQGLINLERDLEKEINHLDNILKYQAKKPQISEVEKYRKWLEKFKDNVRNKFEITHKRVPFVPQDKGVGGTFK